MSMLRIFCDVDDFCLIFEPEWHKQLICNTQNPPVISKRSLNEIMSIIICFQVRKSAVTESVNDQLKNISQIEHSRHQSLFNFAVNLIAGLIAYTRQPRKPYIDVSVLTEGVPMVF